MEIINVLMKRTYLLSSFSRFFSSINNISHPIPIIQFNETCCITYYKSNYNKNNANNNEQIEIYRAPKWSLTSPICKMIKSLHLEGQLYLTPSQR